MTLIFRRHAVKIAHIVGKLKAGGVEAVVFSYLRHMEKEGLEIDVLYDADSTVVPPCDLIRSGINFIEIPPYQQLNKYLTAVKKICAEKKYDIVHSHINTLSGFPLYAAKRAGVLHRIAHNHTTSSKAEGKRDIAKKVTRPITKRYATDFAACSENAARWMFGDKAFEVGKVAIFTNAVDVDKYKYSKDFRDSVRSECGISDEFVLLHIGRFVSTKNHRFIIEIFSKLKEFIPDAKLILIGDGETCDEIKQMTESTGVSDSVIFKGVVSDAERYYSAADAFVLPSFYEGLPVVSVEAQASGLDCFMSDVVTRECAITPRVHFLSLQDGAETWAKQISSVSQHDRFKDGEIVQDSRFNIEKTADDMREYYYKIVSKE